MNEMDNMLAGSTLLIHKMISRGINVSVEWGDKFSQQGFDNDHLQDGYIKYVKCLLKNLEHHHLVEDDVMFPFFHDKLPNTKFDQLEEEHEMITRLIEELSSIPLLNNDDTNIQNDVTEISQTLSKISDLWFKHIRLEEEDFINLIGASVSQDESLFLLEKISTYRDDLFEPYSLTMPFILFNLEPEERQIMAMELPPEIIEELIPHAWKAEWETMTPFFVENIA